MTTQQERSAEIAKELNNFMERLVFSRMTDEDIAYIERKLKEFKLLRGTSSDLEKAFGYVSCMKAPRADKYTLGNRLKDAIWGLDR
jgi:hypothetical protein